MNFDPTTVRLSEHFLLSDFLGCNSVYAKGYRNDVSGIFGNNSLHLRNGIALCEEALEPILDHMGPLSISYGVISPELSQRIVKYQDPNKASHHRWDLGAAADICVHGWVWGEGDNIDTAPVSLAHRIHKAGVPYSRLITYSESPYLCIAVSDKEVEFGSPRKAFYENRYTGVPKVKPAYLRFPDDVSKAAALVALQRFGLAHGWRGGGFPSHHGGGFRQLHHRRVSRYTMLSDWLFDLQSISTGARNVPSRVGGAEEAIKAAGFVYDRMLEMADIDRMSIVQGYVSPHGRSAEPDNWLTGTFSFEVVPPERMHVDELAHAVAELPAGISVMPNSKTGRVAVKASAIYVAETHWGDEEPPQAKYNHYPEPPARVRRTRAKA